MSGGLDMSLDDIIKSNRKRPRGIGGDRGFDGHGPSRRFANRVGTRTAPYSRPIQQEVQEAMRENNVFATDVAASGHQSVGGGGSSMESGTMLYISNLDYSVCDEDIKELFSEVGELKRYGVHYDSSGRSKGIAEVVFSRRGDALDGVKRYNNVLLDGKRMNIEIVGTNFSTPTPPILAPVHVPFPAYGVPDSFNENYNGNFNYNDSFNGNFRGRRRGGFMGRPSGGSGRGNFRGGRRARWGGGGGRRDQNVSADDLDAELEKYKKEAKEKKLD